MKTPLQLVSYTIFGYKRKITKKLADDTKVAVGKWKENAASNDVSLTGEYEDIKEAILALQDTYGDDFPMYVKPCNQDYILSIPIQALKTVAETIQFDISRDVPADQPEYSSGDKKQIEDFLSSTMKPVQPIQPVAEKTVSKNLKSTTYALFGDRRRIISQLNKITGKTWIDDTPNKQAVYTGSKEETGEIKKFFESQALDYKTQPINDTEEQLILPLKSLSVIATSMGLDITRDLQENVEDDPSLSII